MTHILNSTGYELEYPDFIKAKNCILIDSRGNQYLDLESGVWCTSVGHCHPRITNIISDQSAKMMHTGYCYLNPVIDSSGQKILEITAFVFGSGSSAGLVHFPPKELVNEIVREIRKHGAYVISNGVTTGTGRTGKWFGFSHCDFIPDVAAIAKGLGNGYPVSCVVIEDEHIEYFLDSLEEILSRIKQ